MKNLAKDMEYILNKAKCFAIFEEFSDEEIIEIMVLSHRIDVPEGQTFINENQLITEFSIILEGEAKVLGKNPENTANLALAQLRKGDIIGELSMLDKKPCSASVMAISPLILASIPFSEISMLITKNPTLYHKLLANIVKSITHRLRLNNNVLINALQKEIILKDKKLARANFFGYLMVVILIVALLVDFIFYIASKLGWIL